MPNEIAENIQRVLEANACYYAQADKKKAEPSLMEFYEAAQATGYVPIEHQAATSRVRRQVELSWKGSAPPEDHERIKRAAASAKTQLDEFIDVLFEDSAP